MESLRICRGFSLIEMLVVLVIIVTITGVAFTSQSDFNRTLTLSNAAYDIALALRGAETYGLGSRGLGTTANTGYGLHFQTSPANSFTLFADVNPGPSTTGCHPATDTTFPDARPGDCAYQASFGTGGTERVLTYTLGNKMTINKFCVYKNSTNSWTCSSGSTFTSLDIVFARPNPKAYISTGGVYSVTDPPTKACISVKSPEGNFTRAISVFSSGQINATASSCP